MEEDRTMNTNTETFDAHNAKCIRCGMLALRDPWLHAERYGHQPQFQRDGKVFQFDTTQGVSREVK